MNLVVTGSRGFLGTNFRSRVDQVRHSVTEVTRDDDWPRIQGKIQDADAVFHFAGVNRVHDEAEFESGNAHLTARLCAALAALQRPPAMVFASSAQAGADHNAYARSKVAAEKSVADYARSTGATAWISRLPNVFGPWARPKYNSVVATFCFNTSHGRPIEVHEPDRELELVYVDDAVDCLLECVSGDTAERSSEKDGVRWLNVGPTYRIRLALLADVIQGFRAGEPASAYVDTTLAARLRATYDWYSTNGRVFDG